MNPLVPLDIFCPPPEWSHIHLLVVNDLNWLNAGVFMIRVHEWSMWYLSAVLSYPFFRPEAVLGYGEQTAMLFLASEVPISVSFILLDSFSRSLLRDTWLR
jgi:hypothetical protein